MLENVSVSHIKCFYYCILVNLNKATFTSIIYIFVCVFVEGFKEAAEKFRMESGIEPSVDLDSLDERIKIREMILKGQIQEAIALINSLHPELLDTNRYLYFHLQVQFAQSFTLTTSCLVIVCVYVNLRLLSYSKNKVILSL